MGHRNTDFFPFSPPDGPNGIPEVSLSGGLGSSPDNPIYTVTSGSSGGTGGNVTTLPGSFTTVLLNGGAISNVNPFWVTGSVYVLNPSAGGGGTGGSIVGAVSIVSGSVTHISGSVTGLLVGGQPLSAANPLPVGSHTITSGSLTGLLVGGVPHASTNPLWVTGSVFVLNPSAGGTTVTVQSGSVTGLLMGGQPVTPSNPLQVAGAVTVGGTVTVAAHSITSGSVTGLLVGGQPVSSLNPVPVGPHVISSGSLTGLLQGGVNVGQTNPLWVTGSVTVNTTAGGGGSSIVGAVQVISGSLTTASGSIMGLMVGGVAVSQTNPVPTQLTGTADLQMNGVAISSTNPLPVLGFQSSGQIVSGSTVNTIQYKAGTYTASGSANQILAPQGSGVGIRVHSLVMGVAQNGLFKFQSTGSAGTVTDVSGLYPIQMSGGLVLPHNDHGWFQTSTNEGLNISLSAANSVGITLTWSKKGT